MASYYSPLLETPVGQLSDWEGRGNMELLIVCDQVIGF